MQTILILLALIVAVIAAVLVWGWLTTRRAAREAETLMPPLGRSIDVSGGKIHYVEAGFKWHDLVHDAASLSLFAERKLLDVRVAANKLDREASDALRA